jgi:hypothetical protein
MKKSILVITVLAFGLFACGQTPPKSVTDNFSKKFASANKIKWGMEDENEWEAEFKMDGKEMSASFDKEGKWMATEAKLNEKELPANVLKAVKAAYADWKIESVESIETPEMKGYELEIEKGKEELEIQVTADGKITVNKESEEGEDEKEEK